MKSEISCRNKREFRQLRMKIFIRAVGTLAAAAAVIYIIYSFLPRGNFADGMVGLFQMVFGLTYDGALQLYERIFRSHMDAIILCSILLVFAGLFCVYLRWLTRYFEAVSDGMELLLADDSGEISLPSELLPIERKMNAAKHMIVRQKGDMFTAEQRKNDLIMYLAHDLKTPLASTIDRKSVV